MIVLDLYLAIYIVYALFVCRCFMKDFYVSDCYKCSCFIDDRWVKMAFSFVVECLTCQLWLPASFISCRFVCTNWRIRLKCSFHQLNKCTKKYLLYWWLLIILKIKFLMLRYTTTRGRCIIFMSESFPLFCSLGICSHDAYFIVTHAYNQ